MNKRKIYIWLFGLLYGATAFVSTFHAISFFELANTVFLGIVLAITFEIGQAAVLFSILTDTKERKRYMPWVLMTILTLVQIMGNVFASYKGLCGGDPQNLIYFKEPMLFWANLDDKMCNIVLSYVTGAILPIVALCMTGMLTNYLSDKDKDLDSPIGFDDKPVKEEKPIKKEESVSDQKVIENKQEEIENQQENKEKSQFLNI